MPPLGQWPPKASVKEAWSLEQWSRQLLKRERAGGVGNQIPMVGEEADTNGTAPEASIEDFAAMGDIPQLSRWQAEGGPTRKEFCRAYQHCPNLEGLR